MQTPFGTRQTRNSLDATGKKETHDTFAKPDDRPGLCLPTPCTDRALKTIYIVGLLVLIVAGSIAVPWVRRERFRVLILRNQVEEAAAPDERVLTDDWVVDRLLRWKGSPALGRQLVLADRRGVLAWAGPQPEELVVVASEGSGIWSSLRSRGYALVPDAAQERWFAAGDAVRVPFRGRLVIQFAVPSRGAFGPSESR
jgi:hypothetical protein